MALPLKSFPMYGINADYQGNSVEICRTRCVCYGLFSDSLISVFGSGGRLFSAARICYAITFTRYLWCGSLDTYRFFDV